MSSVEARTPSTGGQVVTEPAARGGRIGAVGHDLHDRPGRPLRHVDRAVRRRRPEATRVGLGRERAHLRDQRGRDHRAARERPPAGAEGVVGPHREGHRDAVDQPRHHDAVGGRRARGGVRTTGRCRHHVAGDRRSTVEGRRVPGDRGRPGLGCRAHPHRRERHRRLPFEEGAPRGVPVGAEVVAERRAGREVVVVVAVDEVLVRLRARVVQLHRARPVPVAHDVPLVGAVAVIGGVRRGALHGAEGVQQLVGGDGVDPAATHGRYRGEHGRRVAVVVVDFHLRPVVGIGLAEAAVVPHLRGDQVLPVGRGEAERAGDEGVHHRVEGVDRGGEHDLQDGRRARSVGHPADPAHAAGLLGRAPEDLVDGRRPADHLRLGARVAIALVRAPYVHQLHSVAGDARCPRRRPRPSSGWCRHRWWSRRAVAARSASSTSSPWVQRVPCFEISS